MPDQAMRARVERLLRGEVRDDDLTRLFLFARDRCDGRESVQEIGDFVAHHDKRTKGIITQTVRDWAAIVRIRGWLPNEILNPQRLPAVFPSFLQAMARRLDNKIIKNFTGLTRAQAVAMVPHIISRLNKNADGTFALYPLYTPQEHKVIDCFLSHIVALPAFTGERLFLDFSATLKSNGLIDKNEVRTLAGLKHFIILYAAVCMHQCVIVIDDSFTMLLSTFAHPNGVIQVDCPIPVKTGNPKCPNHQSFKRNIFDRIKIR